MKASPMARTACYHSLGMPFLSLPLKLLAFSAPAELHKDCALAISKAGAFSAGVTMYTAVRLAGGTFIAARRFLMERITSITPFISSASSANWKSLVYLGQLARMMVSSAFGRL